MTSVKCKKSQSLIEGVLLRMHRNRTLHLRLIQAKGDEQGGKGGDEEKAGRQKRNHRRFYKIFNGSGKRDGSLHVPGFPLETEKHSVTFEVMPSSKNPLGMAVVTCRSRPLIRHQKSKDYQESLKGIMLYKEFTKASEHTLQKSMNSQSSYVENSWQKGWQKAGKRKFSPPASFLL